MMSADARDFVYLVNVKTGEEKAEPTIRKETLEKYKADVAKYLPRKEER